MMNNNYLLLKFIELLLDERGNEAVGVFQTAALIWFFPASEHSTGYLLHTTCLYVELPYVRVVFSFTDCFLHLHCFGEAMGQFNTPLVVISLCSNHPPKPVSKLHLAYLSDWLAAFPC